MDRRTALGQLARHAAAGGLVASGGLTLPAAVSARPTPSAAGGFASSFIGVPAQLGPQRVRFDKPLPAGLAGTLYRNGPARMQLGQTKYRHWFDGDGMIQAFRLAGQELDHRGRLVQTSRRTVEDEAGRFLWPGFGTSFADSRPVRKPDDMNVGNISVLPLQDELLALWEGGSAWRIDPQSLATRGRKVFSEATDGLSFSAHPRRDASGRIWNFGYMGGSGKLVLYELDQRGKLQQVKLINAPNADMVHDFAVTERYLVFVLMPLHFHKSEQAGPRSFLEQVQWDSNGAVEVLLVDKTTLTISARMQAPPFFAFHFGNAWDDGASVRVEVARAPDFDALMQTITQASTGQTGVALGREQAMQLVLDPLARSVRIEPLPVVGAEFPRFDQRYTGKRTNHLFMMGEAGARDVRPFGFGQVIAMDRQRGQVSRWDYPEHVYAEEHVFVPRPGHGEGQGWLLGTAYDPRAARTSLQVFNAQAVDAGPIASAQLPYHLPLGLHGQFVTD